MERKIFFLCQSVEIFIEQKRRKLCLHQQWHKWEEEEGRTRYNRFIWKLSILYSNQIFFFFLTIILFFPNFFFSPFFLLFFCVRWYGCVLCIVYWWIHSISKQTLFNILLHILACAFIIIPIREEKKIHSRREIIRRVENKCMGCFRMKHFLTSQRFWNL